MIIPFHALSLSLSSFLFLYLPFYPIFSLLHSLDHSHFYEPYTFPCSCISSASTAVHLMYINERNIILQYYDYVTDLFTMFRNTILHVYHLHHCSFVN